MEQESFHIINRIKRDRSITSPDGDGGIKQLNILLVELINRQFQMQNFPLQLFVLAGSITEHEGNGRVKNGRHDVTIAQSTSSEGIIDHVVDSAQKYQAIDVVGISAHHGNWDSLTKTLSAFRAIPDIHHPAIILGGYLPSYLQSQLLNDFADLPISIAVEHGDISFHSYIDKASLCDTPDGVYDIPGIINPRNRVLIPSRTVTSVYPWLDGVPLEDNDPNKVARMETSRGCFYNRCTFCSRPETQREWVKYSLDDVMKQMTDLAEKGYRKFTFSDEEIVGNDPERFTELMLRIKDLRTEYSDLGFFINARVDNILDAGQDRQGYLDNMWKTAKEAGVVLVWVGAESYSPRQLKLYNKGVGISPQSNLDSIRKLHSAGLKTVQGFIPFHPLMDESELGDNLEFIQRYFDDIIPSLDNPLGFLRVNPRTGYFEHVLKQQEKQDIRLMKEFDPNTLSYPCSYLNSKLGLLASFLYSLKTLTRAGIKHIQWDDDMDSRLVHMRYVNFDLLSSSYRHFTESASSHALETQLVTKLFPWYQKAISEIGLDGVMDDLQDNFASEFERNKSDFLS